MLDSRSFLIAYLAWLLHLFYSTKAEPSSPYSRTTIEEEEENRSARSVSPSTSNFPPIETPVFQSQLRVLNVLNNNFEIDMVARISSTTLLQIL